MTRVTSQKSTYVPADPISPIGGDGLNLFEDGLLPPSYVVRSENARASRGPWERRLGAKKLSRPTNIAKSVVFNDDTKYATLPATAATGSASALLLPVGGFAVYASFTNVWPASGKTAYYVGSRPNGQSYHVFSITVSDAGVITVTWRDTGNTARTVATSAQSNGATIHLLAVYDAVAGTFTVYVNGTSSGTPLTGLASTLQPEQDTGVVWTFGVEKETSAAVTADSKFPGKIDRFMVRTLAGMRVSSGTTTPVTMLRRHSFREWPCPQDPSVRVCYDFNEASGTTLYDWSDFKNHGTYVNSPTLGSDPVAYAAMPGQSIGSVSSPSGQRTNVVVAGGQMQYEVLRQALA